MRQRELEVLEKVAASSKLNVVLGEKGLTDRLVNERRRPTSRLATLTATATWTWP